MNERDTRGLVLSALESHRGEHISGEALAGELGLSRSAVWKAIRELREEGYRIEASTRRGYCLSPENDLLSAEGIRPLLSPSAAFCGERLEVFPELPSTNRTAKERALAGAAHGTVILADRQSAGRGRQTRSFFSPPGGLYMSVILRPDALPIARTPFVTAFAGVAVCGAVEEVTGLSPRIKWVNDLQLEGKKICGILTEAVTDFESGGLEWIVVGIGVNIRGRREDFPEEIRDVAGSVDPEGRVPGIRNRLTAGILNRVLGEEAARATREQVLLQYKNRLSMLGRRVTVMQGEQTWEAVAEDLDGEGRLMLRGDDGSLRALSSGEIRIRVPEQK